MTLRRRLTGSIAVLGCACLALAGCGGGEEIPSGPATTTPGTDQGLVGGTPTTPGGAAAGDSSAAVPDLQGGDVRGSGLGGSGGGLFDPLAYDSRLDTSTTAPTIPTTPLPTPSIPTTPTVPTPKPTFTGASIYVDGIVYEVQKGESFPDDEPIFTLQGVSAKSIELSLVAGEFTSGGGDGVFLDRGDLVSLVNSSEAVAYKVKFLKPTEGGALSGLGL